MKKRSSFILAGVDCLFIMVGIILIVINYTFFAGFNYWLFAFEIAFCAVGAAIMGHIAGKKYKENLIGYASHITGKKSNENNEIKMSKDKSEYQKGLLYFCCLMVCICLFFTTPDGDNLFYKFLGLFGISSGIRLGNATLYIYMLIPLIAAILSIRKVLEYWWSYGLRFREYKFVLRYLPVIISVLVFSISTNTLSPSGIDRIYYFIISQRKGLQPIICYPAGNSLRFYFTGNIRTYSFDITFRNLGKETLEFKAKLIYNFDQENQEVYLKNDNNEVEIFTLQPKQCLEYNRKFTEYYQTTNSSGGAEFRTFTVVLLNDSIQYSPKLLIRHPNNT